MTPTKPALIPLKAAAEYAGIGATKVYGLIDNGDLVARKIGKKTLIESASLDAYIAGLPRVTLRRGATKVAA